jgi:2-oxo-4-hydroxy-4-carboxy-5-ureidoimidazoline decarboxylase
MISLDALNQLGETEFVRHLGNIYEHTPWAAERTYKARPFASIASLLAAFAQIVKESGDTEKLALIKNHPELADKLARAGDLTEESQREQRGAGLDQLSGCEFDIFSRMNQAYRDKFAFPFIICVRRHTKDSILAAVQRRLEHDREDEIETALVEIDRIAALRLEALVEPDGTVRLDGRLSTHVLDTHHGGPAVGVAISLYELSRLGTPRLITRGITNVDGRTDAALMAGRPLPIGRYEICFEMGPYFAARGIAATDMPFLDSVPVRFGIADPEAHYHVPLLVTPWSYTTYRGS